MNSIGISPGHPENSENLRPGCHRRDCFRRLLKEKRVSELEQKFWKVLIRVYSLGMRLQLYFLLALGIRELINHKVDERMSDTGLREE